MSLNTFNTYPLFVNIEEEKANNYLRQLFKLDRKVIEKLKREFSQTTSLTLQKRNSTLLG